MSINYKSEIFDSTYNEIESLIIKANKGWFSSWKIKISYDEKLLKLISFFNIDIIKQETNYLEIIFKDLIFLSFITKLLSVWIKKEKVKEYFEIYKNNENFKSYNFLIDFYILQSLLNQEVNFYIYNWKVELLSSNEFLIIKNKFSLLDDHISINFNKIMFDISKFDWYVNIKNNTFVIEDNIKIILEKYYDKEYKELKIMKKKWKAYMLEANIDFYSKETNIAKISNKFPHSRITVDPYNWKINKYNVTKKIKLNKKDIENED